MLQEKSVFEMDTGKKTTGVLHHTTMDLTKRQAAAYQTITTTLAGTKRSGSEGLVQDSHRATISANTAFKKAASLLGSKPAQLRPSPIISLDTHSEQESSEYSQRKAISATPSASVEPALCLSHRVYGLPPGLVANFASLGIKSIYPWQKNCLLGPGLLSGVKNLIYSAPTGGGKSLVADGRHFFSLSGQKRQVRELTNSSVLMLKRVLAEPGSKALLVLPYVALVQEKVRWLRSVVEGLTRPSSADAQDKKNSHWRKRADEDTVRVVGFFGGSKIKATWADFEIAVCTIEKASSSHPSFSICVTRRKS